MTEIRDIRAGDVFGLWTVLVPYHIRRGRHHYALCRCRCGKEREIYMWRLVANALGCQSCANAEAWRRRTELVPVPTPEPDEDEDEDSPGYREPTEEELDAMIAEQRKTMKGEPVFDKPRAWQPPVIVMGRRHNGRVL